MNGLSPQTGKCGFDQILPLLKTISPLPVALICSLHSKLPSLSQQLPTAHFLLFSHLIFLSNYSLFFPFLGECTYPRVRDPYALAQGGADLSDQVLPKSQPPGMQGISGAGR